MFLEFIVESMSALEKLGWWMSQSLKRTHCFAGYGCTVSLSHLDCVVSQFPCEKKRLTSLQIIAPPRGPSICKKVSPFLKARCQCDLVYSQKYKGRIFDENPGDWKGVAKGNNMDGGTGGLGIVFAYHL